MKQKSTILITGGAGYLGSHISYVLAQQGYKVVILDSFEHNQHFTPQWARVYHGDYGDAHILKKIFKEQVIQTVVHCASSIQGQVSLQKPLECYYANVAKTITLLEVMDEHIIKSLVFCSSSAVYGAPQYIPLDEKHPCVPLTPYGSSKLMIETIIQDCARVSELRFVILRYFNIAGAIPGSGLKEWHIPETHLIPLVISACKSGAPFYLFGNDYPSSDGTAVRDYVHVQDCAFAVHKALEHLAYQKPCDVFNVGTGRGWSVKQVIDTAVLVTQKECKVISSKRSNADLPVVIADVTKARHLLEFNPQSTLLERCLESLWKVEMEF